MTLTADDVGTAEAAGLVDAPPEPSIPDLIAALDLANAEREAAAEEFRAKREAADRALAALQAAARRKLGLPASGPMPPRFRAGGVEYQRTKDGVEPVADVVDLD